MLNPKRINIKEEMKKICREIEKGDALPIVR